MEKGRINNIIEKKVIGTPSDSAMLKYSDGIIDVKTLRKNANIVFEIPFNSSRKYHLMILKLNSIENNQNEYKLLIKGASEILANKCSKIMTHNGEIDFDKERSNVFEVIL